MPDDVGLISESSRLSHSLDLEDTQAAALLASPVISQAYQPETQPIHWFTLEECARKDSSVNRQTKIDGIVHHPRHIFFVNPQEFYHPRLNIQYSQGDIRGGRAHATCKFLYNDGTRKEADCKNENFTNQPRHEQPDRISL